MKTKRKNFTKSAIVNYWIEWIHINQRLAPFGDFDYQESACMACGYWDEIWDKENPRFLTSNWNKSRLEKCHIVPLYLGGKDSVSNMVLMCHVCHSLQPDSIEPEVTFNFMNKCSGSYVQDLLHQY